MFISTVSKAEAASPTLKGVCCVVSALLHAAHYIEATLYSMYHENLPAQGHGERCFCVAQCKPQVQLVLRGNSWSEQALCCRYGRPLTLHTSSSALQLPLGRLSCTGLSGVRVQRVII